MRQIFTLEMSKSIAGMANHKFLTSSDLTNNTHLLLSTLNASVADEHCLSSHVRIAEVSHDLRHLFETRIDLFEIGAG